MNLPATSHRRLRARALTALGAAALVALLTLSGLTARADAWCFDLFSELATPAADPRIVVVAVDRKSLSELGNWPWSRRTHAQLLDRLTDAGARGVALDLLLTEPALYDPEGDALLARALGRNGRTVLPVFDAGEGGGADSELQPIPEFAAAAAALGHADHALDERGESRGLFLHAGLGAPRWPALALALADLHGDDRNAAALPDPRAFDADANPRAWVQDDYRLLPFVRPADGFRRVSYADVLDGRVDAAALRDRWVLVGIDAPGMGDSVAVPGRSGDAGLPEIYYQANALDALANGRAIAPLGLPARIALSSLLVVSPLLLLGLPGFRRLWRPLALAAGLTLLLSLALLAAHAWFPPAATLLVLALGLALWRYKGLRDTRKQAQTDASTGLPNRAQFDAALERELQAARHSAQPLSLLLADVDRYRQLVALHGDEVGEAALRVLADTLRNRARRPRDLVARVGTDEFAVLLPETSAHAAAAIATTLHVDLASLPGKRMDALPNGAYPTVSIGIHTAAGGGRADAAETFSRVEAALYQAKQLGRNRSFTYVGANTGEAAPKKENEAG